ncbi:MAG: 2,3-bisphosphoglycerate-dependent phosphoglycerate mutase [Nitrosomonas sp.]
MTENSTSTALAVTKPTELKTKKLILLRHGESLSNQQKKFTGWSDVPLSAKGEREAVQAAEILVKGGYQFDVCFTSVLQRAIVTAQIVLAVMEQANRPVYQHWRLNERHYGALEDLGRLGAVTKFGVWPVLGCQVQFDAAPPSLNKHDVRFPGNNPNYADIDKNILPIGESMEQTVARIEPYWKNILQSSLKNNQCVLVVAHRNSLRALMMLVDGLTQGQVMKSRLATGRPLVYELDENLKPLRHYYADKKN